MLLGLKITVVSLSASVSLFSDFSPLGLRPLEVAGGRLVVLGSYVVFFKCTCS